MDDELPSDQPNDTPEGEAYPAEVPLGERDFLWAIGSLCRIHQRPFDQRLVREQYPPPHSLAQLREVLGALQLDVTVLDRSPADLAEHQMPALAILTGGGESGEAAAQSSAPGEEPATDPEAEGPGEGSSGSQGDGEAPAEEPSAVALVVRTDGERLVYFRGGTDQPVTETVDEARPRFERTAYTVAPADSAPHDDEADGGDERFGFRWFIPELLRYKRVWRDVLAASLLIQLMGLSIPLFTQVLIDKVIVHRTMSTLTVVAVAMAMFVLFTGIMTWVRQYLVLHTGNRIDSVLGARVFGHLFRLPPRYFEHRSTGTLVARLEGIETIREFIAGAAVTLLLDLPFLFVFLAVMFLYSWKLTLIVVGFLTVIAVLSIAIAPALQRRLNEQFQYGARNQAFMTEYISGVETAKSLQMEPRLRERYGDYLASYLRSTFSARMLFNSYNVTSNTLEQAQTVTILCVGAYLVMTTNSLTVGMLVAFNMFASRMAQPVLKMVGLWQQFQQARVAVRRIGDIMDAPAEPYTLTPTRTGGGAGAISIEGLAFRHGPNYPWLYQDLDVEIPAGSAVAITGPSGCGKSTLAKLLQGFYRPSDGIIRIDGQDVRRLAANELRAHFGVVPQETRLFSGSVYDNLAIANPRVDFEEIVQACKLAEIHDTIEALPDGYQTELGEHGAGLSGGQKQRLAIARALLKRPRILIFDEATSGLDTETAKRFAQTVNRLKGKVTLVFITHQVPQGLELDRMVELTGAQSGEGQPEPSAAPATG